MTRKACNIKVILSLLLCLVVTVCLGMPKIADAAETQQKTVRVG